MNALISLFLLPSLLCCWWSDSCTSELVLQDRLYNYPKPLLQLIDHHLPFLAYHQQLMMSWRLGAENAICKTNFLPLQNMFCNLHQAKIQTKHKVFGSALSWSQGTREQGTAGDKWEGENRVGLKIHETSCSAPTLFLLFQDQSH